MGMTNGQFKAFIRFLINALQDFHDEADKEEKEKKFQQIVEALQAALED